MSQDHTNILIQSESIREHDSTSEIEGGSKIKQSWRTAFELCLLTIIVMIIAISVVCLTQTSSHQLCQSKFTPVIYRHVYQYNSLPISIAAGDFNDDNMLDIAVINSGTNNVGIFINYGNGSFAPQMTFQTGDDSRPFSLVLGDFNNDSHLDIAVANYNNHNISIFLGYGNGTFGNQKTFFVGISRPVSIDTGDLNNDSHLDIVITNNGTNDISIFFGYGNGTFGNKTTYFTGYDSFSFSVVVADFNNDNCLDIAVANYATDNIGIFIGYGNGSFTKQITYSTSPQSNPYAIAVDDFNKDNKLDIVVVNSGRNNVEIFLGYGNGSFKSQSTYPLFSGFNPHSIIVCDYNKDDKLDIAVSNSGANNIGILDGYGNGSFGKLSIFSTGSDSSPFGMTEGDFDNDYRTDVAVANFGTSNILVLSKYGRVQYESPTIYSTGVSSLPNQIAIGDLNNDTQVDLVVSNFGSSNIGIFIGYKNGSYQEQKTYSTGNNSQPRTIVVIDLDNDDILDIVVANSNSESLGILYGYGNGTFANVVTYFTGTSSSIRWLIVNDFNNDNQLDIVFVDYGTNNIGIFLGYGNRTFGQLMIYSSGAYTRPFSVAAGDLNNDGQLDLAIANYATNNIGIFHGFGNGTFSLLTICSTGINSLPRMLTIADLNNDNKLDISVANSGTDCIGVFFGFGNGSFSAQLTYSTGLRSKPIWISVADFNNDSWPDLAVANSIMQNIGVLLGNRQGYFNNRTTYLTGARSQPYSIAVGDFNRDNLLDVAVANYGTNNVAILLQHPNEVFENETDINSITTNVPILLGEYYEAFRRQTTYSTGSSFRPYSIAIGDLNNDSQMDVVMANSGNASLRILIGYGNGSFATQTVHRIYLDSSPRHVIIYDFNKDNKSDLATTDPGNDRIIVLLGNGDGTFSTEIIYLTGPKSNPNTLAVSDLNNDTYSDLIVANRGTNTVGIFFGYDYTDFSSQTSCDTGNNSGPVSVAIGDFNNDSYVDIVSAHYGTSNIGVFLGYGNGSFTPVSIYGNIFASHPWSVAVGDLNNDGYLDIVVAAWGVDNIGILLGYGNGSFAKAILYSTGFNTRPISIAVGDFNNDHCLDITAANYGANNVAVFLGYGNGTFRDILVLSTGIRSRPRSVNVFDINNDTQLDIIATNEGTNDVSIFIGYGNGTFAEQMKISTGTGSSPWYAVGADFNKDGKLDLAIANYGKSNVGILYGYGNGTFGNLNLYTTGIGSNPTHLNVGDFNNDNLIDLIVTDETSNNVGLFFGYNDGTFASISTVFTGLSSSSYRVIVYDFNNDNRLDFIVADNGNNNIHVFIANGSKPFGGQTTFFVGEGSRPFSVAIEQFNNDSYLDIAIVNSGTSNIGILLGNGHRMFSNIITHSTGVDSVPLSFALGDFNNDSLIDMAVANSAIGNIVVLIGYGNGSFYTFMTYPLRNVLSAPVSITVGDFNRDYQLDIAIANYGTNSIRIFFGVGDGTFINQTAYELGYNTRPNWIVSEDLNNDGWEDIAIATYGADNVHIQMNLC